MSIKIESIVTPLRLVTSTFVTTAGSKTNEVPVVNLPRDIVEGLCDKFKQDMLRMHDRHNNVPTVTTEK